MTDRIRFLLDGTIHEIGPVDPTKTALELLRYDLGRTGSKEGCAEGDCGACTVVVGELVADRIVWRPINACILFVPMLDGRALLTVESLGTPQAPHPIQQAMVDRHGSQCGFCTPGIVMSLYARSIMGAGDAPLNDALAGNLCRCTGYGPILAAARDVPPQPRDDAETIAALRALRRDAPLDLSFDDPLAGAARRWIAPRTVDQLARCLMDHPEAQIVAGATDVGLWVTKAHRVLPVVVHVGDVAELGQIDDGDAEVRIGAGARYADAQAVLARLHPSLDELVRRIGGVQVRNVGTIGGNIANGSPVGDMPPVLIALGARLVLRRGDARRELPLQDYFLDYGKQDRRPSEFIEAVIVPRPPPGRIVHVSKLSKRFDSDISALCGAFAVDVDGGIVTGARIAFGGMAGIPRRAPACEAALVGSAWTRETMERAARALPDDFQPLSDVRGSAAYRLRAAGALLTRMWLQATGGQGAHDLMAMEAIDG
ncbi:MAG: hypothetical protein JWO72_32 [Caulobacteraceae bacterium]|nr:hypothetical protein [Caulobacteraceae bacterium]